MYSTQHLLTPLTATLRLTTKQGMNTVLFSSSMRCSSRRMLQIQRTGEATRQYSHHIKMKPRTQTIHSEASSRICSRHSPQDKRYKNGTSCTEPGKCSNAASTKPWVGEICSSDHRSSLAKDSGIPSRRESQAWSELRLRAILQWQNGGTT